MSTPTYNSGEMDKYVAFRIPTSSRGTAGGVILSWEEVVEKSWAKWIPARSEENVRSESKRSEVTGVIRIRHRTDIDQTWKVTMDGNLYEILGPPLEVDRRGFLDIPVRLTELAVVDAAVTAIYSTSQIFEIELTADTDSIDVEYPIPFDTTPRGLSVQLLTPTGGSAFTLSVRQATKSSTGFTVDFGALVPAAGYWISVIAIP